MPTARRMWTLNAEPVDELFRSLLTFTLELGHEASVTVHPTISQSANLQQAIAVLSPYLVDESEVVEWPGTRLLSGTARLLRLKWNPRVVSAVLSLSTDLYSWKQPELPEDLCVYRMDSSPLLATITHEQDAFLCLSQEGAPVRP